MMAALAFFTGPVGRIVLLLAGFLAVIMWQRHDAAQEARAEQAAATAQEVARQQRVATAAVRAAERRAETAAAELEELETTYGQIIESIDGTGGECRIPADVLERLRGIE